MGTSYYWQDTTPMQGADAFKNAYGHAQNALQTKDTNYTKERMAVGEQLMNRAAMSNLILAEKVKAAYTPLKKVDITGAVYEEWPQIPANYYGQGVRSPEEALQNNTRAWYNFMLTHPAISRNGNMLYYTPGFYGGTFQGGRN